MTTMTNAPSARAAWQDEDVLWHYGALCGLALPLRTPRTAAWSRQAGGTGAAMGLEGAAAAAGEAPPLPAGPGLRLLLLHVFTAALRGDGVAAEIGPDAASAAASLGLEATPSRTRELEEQAARLLAARLHVVGEERGAPMPVLDSRARRAEGAGWRPALRLNARFFASLRRNAVALDRRVVAALAGSAAALDAYSWLTATAPDAEAARPVLVPWESLRERFGQGTAPLARFAAAFSASLEAVRTVQPAAAAAARFTIGQDGVELHGAAAAPRAAAATVPSVAAEPPAAVAPVREALPAPGPVRERDPAAPPSPAAPSPAASDPEPPQVVPSAAARRPGEAPPAARADRPTPGGKPARAQERDGGRIGLAPGLTGLPQTVWLRRGGGQPGITQPGVVIEITPGADYHPARRSLLVLEPMVMQVAGHLPQRELDQVAAWIMANADLIQDYWDGLVASAVGVAGRIKRVPTAPRW